MALVCDDIDPNVIKPQKTEEDLENIYVTFLSLGFLKNTLIASGDDGYVIISFHIIMDIVILMGTRKNCEKNVCT